MFKLGNLRNNIPTITAIMLLALITVLAVYLRLYHLGTLSFWQDELYSAAFSKLVFKDLLQQIWHKDVNVSFFDLLLNVWAKNIPNPTENTLRLLSAFFSIISILIVFLLGRSVTEDKKKGTAIGVLASFLITVNALHIQYAQELRGYSLELLLTALSTLLLIKSIEKRNSPLLWAGYAFVSALSISTHFFASLLLIAHAFSLFFLFKRGFKRFPVRWIIGACITTLILIIPITTSIYLKRDSQLISWIPYPTVKSLVDFLIGLSGNRGPSLMVLYVCAAITGVSFQIFKMRKQKDILDEWKLMLIVCCLVLPIGLAFLISSITPIFVSRYFLFVMPYLTLLAAAGIINLLSFGEWKKGKIIGIIVLLVIISLQTIGVKNYFENFKKEDYRSLTKYMSKNCISSLKLYYPPWDEPHVRYYNINLKSQISTKELLVENTNLQSFMQHIPNNYGSVCLMLGPIYPETSVERNQLTLIQTSLRKKFSIINKVTFYRLSLIQYSNNK